jgi:hypothetical protein
VEVELNLFASMLVVIASSWLVLGLGFLWGRAAGRGDPQRGSLTLRAYPVRPLPRPRLGSLAGLRRGPS